MDLQAPNQADGRQTYVARIAAVLCFILAGALLIGSLASAKAALPAAPAASLIWDLSGGRS